MKIFYEYRSRFEYQTIKGDYTIETVSDKIEVNHQGLRYKWIKFKELPSLYPLLEKDFYKLKR